MHLVRALKSELALLLAHPVQAEALSRTLAYVDQRTTAPSACIVDYLAARRDYLQRWHQANDRPEQDSLDLLKRTAQRVGLAWPQEYTPESCGVSDVAKPSH